MLTMAISEWRRLSKEETIKTVPVILTIEGEAVLTVDKIDEVIALSDMHPRIKTQLRALEMKARAGMPPVKKLFVDDMRMPG